MIVQRAPRPRLKTDPVKLAMCDELELLFHRRARIYLRRRHKYAQPLARSLVFLKRAENELATHPTVAYAALCDARAIIENLEQQFA